jgi:hypothetical protein
MARATHLTTRAGNIAPEGSLRFSNKIIITDSSFAPGQVPPSLYTINREVWSTVKVALFKSKAFQSSLSSLA